MISAEYSVLHELKKKGRLTANGVVHLIHTPSFGGRLAVATQSAIIEREIGFQVVPRELPVPFDPSIPGGLSLASGAFIGMLSDLFRHNTPNETAFAPIGSYKVMVALGQTAASFHGFSSLYIHEDSQVIQEIAPIPILLPPSEREKIASTARKVGSASELSTLPQDNQAIIRQYPSFFIIDDGVVALNELGQFLRLDETPILLLPQANETLLRNPNLLTGQILQIKNLAMQNPAHPGINHDLVTTRGRNHPWRLAQMANGIRIAWQLHEQSLLIGRIWTNHGQYEAEAPSFITSALNTNLQSYIQMS